jgi:hypothetical protein
MEKLLWNGTQLSEVYSGLVVSMSNTKAVKNLRPEERAPKSGLPDFGNQRVSKPATADFDWARSEVLEGRAWNIFRLG